MKNKNTVRLTKEQVEAILVNPEPDPTPTQGAALVSLFKLVFPEFDEIAGLDGFPKINKETNEYLFKLWIAFDQKYHPDVINGGCWMNYGWSSAAGNEHLAFLEVERCAVTLKVRELAAA
jgi:hypothetical protein